MSSALDWPPPSNLTVKIYKKASSSTFKQMTEGAAGFDLAADISGDFILEPFTPVVIPSGIYMAMPPGMEATVRPRSSLSRKGILAMFGTIDSDYRGEAGVTLINLTNTPYTIQPGDRIAQMVFSMFAPVHCEIVSTVTELGETVRGTAGFGSTGR